MYSLNILHLYPDILNLYADRGNILALQYCAQKIDVSINIKYLFIGDEFPADIDLILIGGGQDQDQEHCLQCEDETEGERAGRGLDSRVLSRTSCASQRSGPGVVALVFSLFMSTSPP